MSGRDLELAIRAGCASFHWTIPDVSKETKVICGKGIRSSHSYVVLLYLQEEDVGSVTQVGIVNAAFSKFKSLKYDLLVQVALELRFEKVDRVTAVLILLRETHNQLQI